MRAVDVSVVLLTIKGSDLYIHRFETVVVTSRQRGTMPVYYLNKIKISYTTPYL